MQLHPFMNDAHTHTHAGLGFLHICNSLETDIARTERKIRAAGFGISGYWDVLVIYLPFLGHCITVHIPVITLCVCDPDTNLE